MQKPKRPSPDAHAAIWEKYYDDLNRWKIYGGNKSSGGSGRSGRGRSGGTMNSTAFRTRERTDGSGKRDIWFNGPGDRGAHGHVVESTNPDGSTKYHYARDVEGNEYDVP